MTDRVEATGRTVEDALQSALATLAAQAAEVRYEVVEPGGGGFLGLFGRPARVRVERIVRRHADVRTLVADLMAAMEVPADIEAHVTEQAVDVRITTRGMDGLLIGKRGQTLAALQHVIGRLVSKEFGIATPVSLDIGDYRRRREAQLADKARALAEKVRVTGREINLEPLHATDRRVVHLALAGMRGIRSYTVGQGLHRNVVIAPDARRHAT